MHKKIFYNKQMMLKNKVRNKMFYEIFCLIEVIEIGQCFLSRVFIIAILGQGKLFIEY